MKTLITSLVIALAGFVAAAFIARLLGASYGGLAAEAGLAAFASLSLIFITVADYSRRRTRAAFVSKEVILTAAKLPVKSRSLRSRRPCVPSLTGVR